MFNPFPNRVTLVVGDAEGVASWVPSVVHVESLPDMHETAANDDVERIILRSATADEFLHLLAAMPHLAGDVMLIRHDGRGFLSATGRGGDRVLYALSPTDVAFYLDTNRLTNRLTSEPSCTRPS